MENERNRTTDSASGLCNLFFKNGVPQVQQMLVDAIHKEREQRKMLPEELDELCYLKEDNLSTCAQFEKQPSLMKQEIFCRVAAELDLQIDQILNVDLPSDKMRRVIENMKANGGGLAAAAGGAVDDIPLEKVASVYVMVKILDEI
jgi:hypothetical protein